MDWGSHHPHDDLIRLVESLRNVDSAAADAVLFRSVRGLAVPDAASLLGLPEGEFVALFRTGRAWIHLALESGVDEPLSGDGERLARVKERLAESPGPDTTTSRDASPDSRLRLLLDLARADDGELLPDRTALLGGADLLAPVRTPASIGPYQIKEILGRGGMGIVYLAEQQSPRRKVALKTIRGDSVTADTLRRFQHEPEFLARLRHPGIAQVFEAGSADVGGVSVPYYVMEYVEGRPVTEHVADADLGVEEKLHLLAKICDAVDHAHRKDVVHRDLKPTNVLVDAAGEPRVLDFGIARLLGDDRRATRNTDPGAIVGTLPYMSPEQVAGQGEIDARADVYALGVLGYEILSGGLPIPVQGLPLHQASQAIADQDPIRLGACDPAFRGDLETIFTRALEKEPSRRYASAAALAADLRRFLGHEPIAARPPSTWYALTKLARRNRAAFSATAAIVVLALAGAVFWGLRERTLRTAIAREQETLAAVLDFHLAMLSSTARAVGGGANVRVVDVLVEEAARVDDGGQGRPGVEAGIRRALGSSFAAIGMYDEAILHLRSAAALDALTHGAEALETLRSRGELGEILNIAGAWHEADALLTSIVRASERVLGPNHAVTLRSLDSLAAALDCLGRHEEAAVLIERALERARRSEEYEQVLEFTNHLALVLNHQGHSERAASLLRGVVDELISLYTEEHRLVCTARNNLASALQDLQRWSEAETLYRRASDWQERNYGADHPLSLRIRGNLALLLKQTGRLEEAKTEYQGILDAIRSRPDAHPFKLLIKNNFAKLLKAQGKRDEAETLLRDALASCEAANQTTEPTALSIRNNLGSILYERNAYAEAEAILADTWRDRSRTFGHDHPQTLKTALTYAQSVFGGGDFARAEGILQEILPLFRARLGDDHDFTVLCAQELACACVSLGRPDEALAREVLERRRTQFGDLHRDTMLSAANLGASLSRCGRHREALETYSIAERALAAGAGTKEEHADIRTCIVSCLAHTGRLDEAEAKLAEIGLTYFDPSPANEALRQSLYAAISHVDAARERPLPAR